MDIKSLIARMDEIENKKESSKSTIVESIQKTKSPAVVKKTSSRGRIAEVLMRDLGYDFLLEQSPNPWEGKDPEKAAAWAALSPEDQQWLGGADPTDQFILMRAPNKGKPAASNTAGVDGSTAATSDSPDGPDGNNAPPPDEVAGSTAATPDQPDGPDGNNAPAAAPTSSDQGGEEEAKAYMAVKKDKLDQLNSAVEKLKAAMSKAPAAKAPAAPAPGAPKQAATPKPQAGGGIKATPGLGQISDTPAAESRLSESEIISNLRKKLESIDSKQDQEVDEFIGSLAKGAANIGKNFMSGLKGGGTVQQVNKAGQFGKVAPGGKAANAAGKAVAANPGKTALGTAAVGAAAGYGLSGGAGKTDQSATPKPPTAPSAPKPPTAPSAPAAGAASNPEVKGIIDQINALVQGELSTMPNDPEVIAAIKNAESVLATVK